MAYDQRSLDDYVDVAERIQEFRERHPSGSLRGTFQMLETGGQAIIAYRAEAYRTPDDQAPGVGCAWELVPGRTPFTRGSELQNAETSAWGRAIIAVGAADAKRGIASRQEVANARARQASRDELEDEAAARAQRRHAPETRADGSATEAEQERMRSGSEPGTWRASGTAENDPFYDQPGEPLAPAEDEPGSIAKRQLSMMHAKFAALGITEREKRLRWTEIVIGRPVESANDLSYREAGQLLEALTEEARERSRTNA